VKKYCNGANAYHAFERSLNNTDTTPQNYYCYRVTDIFETSAQVLNYSTLMPEKNKTVPISVLMPVYNEKEEYLRVSIESILNQTFQDFEFLIIDDDSTDKTCFNILEEYAKKDSRINLVRYKREKESLGNRGLTRVLNKGLSIAKGKYIARMDSDDVSEKNRLQTQYSFMENNPDYVLCGSWSYVINDSDKIIGRKKGYTEYEEIKKKILITNSFTHSSWFFKKSAIEAEGNYSEEMSKAQDYDLLLRLIPKYPVAIIPNYLLRYRAAEKSISFSNNKLQEKYAIKIRLKALREYDYPKSYYLKIIIPLFLYLFIPSSIKKILMKLQWKI
jgi:glycosyltransferase involved in cell wall biosynthesis